MTDSDQSSNNLRVLEGMKRNLRPLQIYLGVRTNLVRSPVSSGRWRYIIQFGLARTGSNPSGTDRDAMRKQADQAWEYLIDNQEIQQLVAQLHATGVSVRRGSQGDACGDFEFVYIEVDPDRLDDLKDLAEKEAGLHDYEARTEAEHKLQRWLRQNYHRDWKRYRETEPIENDHPFVAAFSSANPS